MGLNHVTNSDSPVALLFLLGLFVFLCPYFRCINFCTVMKTKKKFWKVSWQLIKEKWGEKFERNNWMGLDDYLCTFFVMTFSKITKKKPTYSIFNNYSLIFLNCRKVHPNSQQCWPALNRFAWVHSVLDKVANHVYFTMSIRGAQLELFVAFKLFDWKYLQ